MMTMLTTVFGMLPIAVGMGEGANIVQPLGIAVSGGLFISTLFTLFMVPSILSFTNIGEKQ
jgi:HAE1 family hydrophobic/amphiphilic exporter-1